MPAHMEPSPKVPAAPLSPRTVRLVVVVCLGAFAALCAHGLRWDTPTVDEFAHLPAGYYYLRTGNFALFAQNPPLVKMVMALPLLAVRPDLDVHARIENSGWYPWIFGTDFMERNRAAYPLIFLLGRSMIVLLGLLLGGLVFVWARRLYGDRGGLLALVLYAFSPTLVAHAHLATIDVGHALAMLLALFCFARYLEKPGWGWLLLAGVTLGTAQLTKFTALLLYPALALLALVALARGEEFPLLGARTRSGRRGRLAWSLAALAVVFVVSGVVVDAGYLFQGVGRRLDWFHFQSHLLGGVAAKLPGALRVPLPTPYLYGLDGLQYINDRGEFPGYLFGHWSSHGWASYYLVAILYKTPLPFLALFALAALARRRVAASGERALWLSMALLFLAFTFLSRVDYGIRYVLPLLPLACIYIGRLAVGFEMRPRLVRRGVVALVALYPLSVLLATPDTISYFNLLARGRGDRVLLDSNYDWGQGLKRLQQAMVRRGLDSIPLAYFGHVDPAIYGVDARPLPPRPFTGYAAVSANFVHGYPYATYADGKIVPVPENAYRFLENLPIEEDLGGGIFLYRLPPPGGGSAPASP